MGIKGQIPRVKILKQKDPYGIWHWKVDKKFRSGVSVKTVVIFFKKQDFNKK